MAPTHASTVSSSAGAPTTNGTNPQLFAAVSDLIAAHVVDGLAARDDALSDDAVLYSGRLGAAVFLAAHGLVADDEQSKAIAVRIADEIVSATAETDAVPDEIGALVGRGGLIYGLTKIGQLTGERAIAEAAQQRAARITPEAIAHDPHLDVGNGAAGALLALLALPDPTRDLGDGTSAVDRAEMCAQHLLRQRDGSSDDRPIWMSAAAPSAPQSGFAHGAAGVAAALARLHRQRPDAERLEAIFHALDFVEDHYVPELDNWIPSAADAQVSTLGWCHGAPGVALAHLSILADLAADDPHGRAAELARPLQMALNACARHRPTPLDHLCCGNMTRAEVFLVAHRQFADPALLDHGQRFARWVLRSAKTHGRFVVPEHHSAAYGFFQGLSGVGYSFLRILEPRRLPCVLLMA
ncbi:MAG: lanthionine synthetase LanC family protein [Acidobacteriota bacterium]